MQKGESKNWCFKKTMLVKFSISVGKKCSFFGKFDVLCFLETPLLRFALLPYYRRIHGVVVSSPLYRFNFKL